MDQLTTPLPSPPRPPGRVGGPGRGDPTSRNGGTRRAMALVGGLLALMLAGGAVTALLSGHTSGTVTERQLAARSLTVPGQSDRALPASLSAVLGLTRTNQPVRNFTLTDQHGATVRLAGLLRHRAVVLTFMDDRCRDVCPLVAQELVDAYHDLGPAARRVDFVAVNVNAAHSAPVWLRRFIATSGHGIGAVPTFDFLTGTPAALRRVWADYGMRVKITPTGTVYHSEAMYFIGPGGTMRYLATPFADLRPNGTGWLPPATIGQWGRGIARYARATLG